MRSLYLSLIKYLSLLLALVFTAGNLLYNLPDTSNLLFIQIGLGIIYIAFSLLEFTKQLEKINLPHDRFFYFPLSYLSVKLIKLGALSIASVILFISKSNLVFLGSVVLFVVFADALVFTLRISKKFYYVSLFANYILFSLEHETKIFASQIKIIEYRYGIFYLQLKNGKMHKIEVARIKKSLQANFTEKFVLWVVCNKLHFTKEAKEKLADIIAEAI